MTYPQTITLACSIVSVLISCLSLWISRAAIRRARGVDAALDQVEQLLADRIATWGRDGEDGFSVNGGIGGKGGKGGGGQIGTQKTLRDASHDSRPGAAYGFGGRGLPSIW